MAELTKTKAWKDTDHQKEYIQKNLSHHNKSNKPGGVAAVGLNREPGNLIKL